MEERKMRKTIALLLVAGLLTTSMAGMAIAADKDSDPWRALPYYMSVTGTVVSVEELDDGLQIKIEYADGNPAYMYTSDKTVFPFENEVFVGDVVTGFYLANAPMAAIWPPQYTISVLAAGAPEGMRIIVDRFYEWDGNSDGFLLAQGGAFAFRVDENTEIILANGDDFSDGEYVGRRIAVIFDASTRSIPELATARKLIVLYEDPVFLPDTPSPELLAPIEDEDPEIDASGWPILVNGALVDAPEAIQIGDAVLVPLRAIAEALGFEVKWVGATRSVTLDETIKITIGDTACENGDSVIELASAPILVNGFTYVPLEFFRNVLDLPNAFAFEGQIDIQSEGERME